MEFNHDVALRLIEQHGLRYPNTYYTWKKRGIIPDRYTREDFRLRLVSTEDKASRDRQRLMEVLDSKKINTMQLMREAGIPYHYYNSAKRPEKTKHVELSDEHVRLLRNELQRWRITIKAALPDMAAAHSSFSESSKQRLQHVLEDKRFVMTKLLHASRQNSGVLYDRLITRRKNPEAIYEDWEVGQLADHLSVFLLETWL